MTRRKCPVCKLIKEMRSGQHSCSKSCASTLMNRKKGKAWQIERGKKAGAASGEVRAKRRDGKYSKIIEILGAVRACRLAYNRGYAAGHRARRYYEQTDRMLRDRTIL